MKVPTAARPPFGVGLRSGHRLRLAVAAGLASATAALLPGPAAAAAYTWMTANPDGTGASDNWSTGFGPTAPPSDFATQLTFIPGTYRATEDIASTFNLNAITVNNTDGNTLTLAGLNTLAFGGTNPALNVTGGSVVVQPQLVTGDGTRFIYGGGGTFTVQNGIAFASNGSTSIVNTGPGTVTLADATAYFGTNSTINLGSTGGGTIQIGNLGGVSGITGAGVTGTLNVTAGTVSFAGSTSGDLFTNGLILNVAAGATFNFADNGETFGGLTGGGNVLLGSAGLSFVAPGNRTFTGAISGTGGVTQNVNAVLTLGGANTFSGTTTVAAGGTLRTSAAGALSPNSVVSVTNGALDLGGFSQTIAGLSGGSVAGSLPLGGSTLTIDPAAGGSYSFAVGLTGAGRLVVNGPGTQSLAGNNAYTGTTTVSAGTLRLNVGGLVGAGGTATVATGATLDAIVPANAAAGTYFNGTGTLVKEGAGNLTFAAGNANFAPGAVVVTAGTLTLDQTTDNTSKLPAGTPLTLGGGSLAFVGNGSAASGQAFGGLTLGGAGTNGGSGSLAAAAGSGQTAVVSLGGITRNAGTAVDFEPTTAGASITTTTAATNGILGGWATVNGSGFATATGGAIAPLATYAASFTGPDATANVSLSGNATAGVGTLGNSLRFTGTSALTFTNASSGLTLTSGGVLVVAGVTGATSIGTTTTRGTLAAPAGQDLIVNQFGTGTLTVNSAITGTGGLTKAGPGTLSLTGTNPYTGGTYINAGSVSAANVSLGAASSPVVFNGGTLALTTASVTFTNAIHPVTVAPAGGTLNLASNETFQGNGLTGTGTLTKAGIGTLSVGSNASPFSGNLAVAGGVLRETASALTRVTGLTLAAGTEFLINDDATANFGIAPGAPVTFAGGAGPTGSATPGAFVLTDQTPTGPAGVAPNTTFTNPFTFLTDTTIGVYNGNAATGRLAQLTFPNPIAGTGNLIKVGDGTLVLSSPNNAFGNNGGTVVVANGTLRIGVDNAVPTAATLQLGQTGATTSGTFDLNGFNQTVAGFSTAGSGTAEQVVNTSTAAASVLTANAAAGTGQTFAGQIGGGTVSAPANANLSLVKAGTGTLTLAGTNTFAGAATVSAGTLRVLGGANNLARPYVVNDGANLTVANTDPNVPLTATTLTVGNTGPSTLGFELDNGTPGPTGVLAVNAINGVTLNGTINVAVTSSTGTVSVGQFPLFSYAGSLGGGGFAAFNPNLSLPSRAIGSLVNDTANHSVDLSITGVDFIKYTGAVNSNFDINTTANFALNSSGGATTYLDQPSPDSVVFDDSATGSHTLSLSTTLRPAAVTVNTASGYTFAGSGSLAGTTGLAKAGTGTLTLLTNNTYTGVTAINAGTIQVGTGGTTGSVGTGPVANAGTLAVDRSDAVTLAGNITGTGTVATIGGGTTTLTGTNTVGGLTVSAGTLGVAGVTTLTGNAAGPGNLTLPGGTLVVNAPAEGVTVANAVSGTGNVNVSGGAATFTGPLSYTGTTAIGGNTLAVASDANSTLANVVSGTGTLAKSGAGTLTLTASDTAFTGTVIVNGGTVLLDDPTTTGGDLNAASIVVNNTGTFIFGPNGNADFPENTLVTVNAGGTYKLQQSENYGGIVLNGGTYVGGNGNSGFNTNADAAQGYNFSSGTVTSSGTGTATLSTGNAAGTTLDKYTDGTVTFTGASAVGPLVTLNVHQGTLAFGAANLPGTGTTTITLGDTGTTGTLQLTDAGTAATVRPIALAGNGGVISIPNAAGSLTVNAAVTGSAPLTLTGAGTLALTGANTYAGGTTVAGGTLRANNPTGSATGTGTVTVAAGGTLGGNGSTGAVVVASGGTVTAGQDAATIGTLNTGPQTWSAGGADLAKTDGTTADRLVLSGLTLPSSGTFAVNVTALNAKSGASVAAGTTFVLATDTEPQATNPFASAATLASLTLNVGGGVGVAGGGSFALAEAADASGGYDLLLSATSAAPEPASLLLLGTVAAPLLLGRRRPRRRA